MRVIRVVEEGVFVDSLGQVFEDDEFFELFSHEGEVVSIRTVGKVPSWFPLSGIEGVSKRQSHFELLWLMIEEGGYR